MEEKTNTLTQQPTCENLEQKIETQKKKIAVLQESLTTLQEKGKTFVNQKMGIEEELKNTTTLVTVNKALNHRMSRSSQMT